VGVVADAEAGLTGDDVEPFVVPGMAVLGRPGGVRGNGDLDDAEPMVGGVAVLQDPDLDGAQVQNLAGVRSDERYVCNSEPPSWLLTYMKLVRRSPLCK
jgi:hypothetical protein